MYVVERCGVSIGLLSAGAGNETTILHFRLLNHRDFRGCNENIAHLNTKDRVPHAAGNSRTDHHGADIDEESKRDHMMRRG